MLFLVSDAGAEDVRMMVLMLKPLQQLMALMLMQLRHSMASMLKSGRLLMGLQPLQL